MKIAFTPVIYEHAARFVRRAPWDVSRDADLMFEAHRRAYMEYHRQVIMVGIDIVNLDLGIVACPEPDRIYRAVDEVLRIVGGRPQCLMGTGALPLETLPENVHLIRQYVA